MTNEQNEKLRLELVTPKLFSTFLSEKKGVQHCLSCGSPKIVVPEIDQQTFTASLEGSSSSIAKNYVTYYKINELKPISTDNSEYRVICTNCGFTSRYWAHIVVNWVETTLLSSPAQNSEHFFATQTKDGEK